MNATSEIELPSEWEIASMNKMVSYSIGFVIYSYLLNTFTMAVFYFYEVEVGLPIDLVVISFVIFAIWSMINYPLLGYLTDRSIPWLKSWGIRAPWIIISAIMSLIFYFLIFIPPVNDIKTNPWPTFWYMLVITCIFDTFYTIYVVHFIGGFVNQFREDFERMKASVITLFIPGMILFFMGFIWPLTVIYGKRSTFALAALIAVLALAFCTLILIPGVSESEEVRTRYLQGRTDDNKTSFLKMLKITFRQKNFTTSLISYVLGSIGLFLGLASGIYFIKDILRMPLYVLVFTSIAYFIAFMIAVPYWFSFSTKHGHVTTYIIGLILSSLALIPYLWITTLEEAIIFSFVRGFVDCSSTIVLLMILSDVYDEITLLTGKHQEAMLMGIRSFFFRSSVVFQAIIIAWIHIATGYNPDPLAEQSAAAIWGIRVHMALIPMICYFLAGIIMIFFYDLKGEKQKLLKRKLREKGL